MVERTLPSSTYAIFGGWQLNAMAIGFAAALLVPLVKTVIALVRGYRNLRGRTPHRRAVVLAAFVPGLFLGGLAGNPMSAAISWASNQTADAGHARLTARQLLAEYGKTPPVHTTGKPAAPAALAALLLRTSDLGRGWYSQQQPNPAETPISRLARRSGATAAVRATLNQAHWTGNAWLPQHLVVEGLLRFPSPDAAGRYRNSVLAKHATTITTVGGLPVYETGLGEKSAWRSASFIAGADLFTLTVNVDASGTPAVAAFDALVAKAVARATGVQKG
jgi:hypothetical protein